MLESNFKIISGKSNIILVVPHGYQDEEHLGKNNIADLAILLAQNLNCHAVINTEYRRPMRINNEKTDISNKILDLNDLREYRNQPVAKEFVNSIHKAVKIYRDKGKPAFVFYIQKIDDKDIDQNVQMLLGVGFGDTDLDNSLSAPILLINVIIERFKELGIISRTSRNAMYAGRAPHELNQLYRLISPDDNVFSIQIGIAWDDLGNENSVEDISRKMTKVISQLPFVDLNSCLDEAVPIESQIVSPRVENQSNTLIPFKDEMVPSEVQLVASSVEMQSDELLVEQAYTELKRIFIENYEKARNNAMVEAGRYIVKTFYGDNYHLAKDKKQAVKKEPLHRLILKLQEKSIDAPSKTWIYDAVGLAVDDHELGSFRTYGKISVSHKLKLLTVKDPQVKEQLVTEIDELHLSVRDLSERVREMSSKNNDLRKLVLQPNKLFSKDFEVPSLKKYIDGLAPDKRREIRQVVIKQTEQCQKQITKHQNYIDKYKILLNNLSEINKPKKGKSKLKP